MEIFRDHNLIEFAERFKTDEGCKKYLSEIKWAEHYVCRKCGHTKSQIRKDFSRTCNICSDTESSTANTLFHLNLSISDDIPDSKTVWNFRQQIVDLELVDPIFNLFIKDLEKLGLVFNEGKIIDASFIEVPRQRNSEKENAQIKKGETPNSFDENPNKKSQKDSDARWTQKNNANFLLI